MSAIQGQLNRTPSEIAMHKFAAAGMAAQRAADAASTNFTVDEAAGFLNWGRSKLYEALKTGELGSHGNGRHRMIPLEAMVRLFILGYRTAKGSSRPGEVEQIARRELLEYLSRRRGSPVNVGNELAKLSDRVDALEAKFLAWRESE